MDINGDGDCVGFLPSPTVERCLFGRQLKLFKHPLRPQADPLANLSNCLLGDPTRLARPFA